MPNWHAARSFPRPTARYAERGTPPYAPTDHWWPVGYAEEHMALSQEIRRAKLAKLVEIEGRSSLDSLLEAVITDSVSPAICVNEGCSYSCEMPPARYPI